MNLQSWKGHIFPCTEVEELIYVDMLRYSKRLDLLVAYAMWVTSKQRHDRSKVSNCSGIYIYVQLPGQWAHWWSPFLYLLGFETTLYQHIPGMCRQIPGGSWFGEIHYSMLFHLERNGCSCGCPDGPICFTDLCLSVGSLVADSCLQS